MHPQLAIVLVSVCFLFNFFVDTHEHAWVITQSDRAARPYRKSLVINFFRTSTLIFPYKNTLQHLPVDKVEQRRPVLSGKDCWRHNPAANRRWVCHALIFYCDEKTTHDTLSITSTNRSFFPSCSSIHCIVRLFVSPNDHCRKQEVWETHRDNCFMMRTNARSLSSTATWVVACRGRWLRAVVVLYFLSFSFSFSLQAWERATQTRVQTGNHSTFDRFSFRFSRNMFLVSSIFEHFFHSFQ